MSRSIARRWLFAIELTLCLPATASEWTTPDKRWHLFGSAGMGLVATALTDSNAKAFGGCLAVGAAKELVSWAADRQNRPDGRDMVMNALGCGMGVAGGRFIAGKVGDRTTVAFVKEF